jgi:hypothetical protein
MKKFTSLVVLSLLVQASVFSQVDTTFIYNQNTPYGTLDIRIAKSPTRYYYLQENVTFSFRESSPGVKTNTFYDMTSWDSSPYTEGNLREKIGDADNFVMNYRLLKPIDYNSTVAKGYPLIIMMHGSGETGNCWNSNCFHATGAYDPVINDPPAPTSADSELLNNDHSLLHGGKVYLDAVNLAGNKLPDDPSLATNAFPGFILFPQNLDGWTGNAAQDAIRIVRLLVKKYNIDENRIFINGLSNGGHGLFEAVKRAPWMFAGIIAMSAVDDGFITNAHMEASVARIPMWFFQGALDTNPTPNKTKSYIKRFRDAGAIVRYTEYADVGHTTWNRAYKEPDFFSWMLGENKAAIHIFAGNASICGGGAALNLQLPEGFKAYQWEKDGQIINGANMATYQATVSGNYRARFSRTSTTPAEADWNDWSPKVEVKIQTPPTAEITQHGTVLLKDLNGGNIAQLEAASEFAHYYWYKNGTLLDFPGDQDDTLKVITLTSGSCNGTCTGAGAYTLVTSNYDNCNSAPSSAKNVFFNDMAPVNITAPSELKGQKSSASTITLQWKDNASTEGGFEIWRRKKTGDNQFSIWEMATITDPNIVTFTDSDLEPSMVYQYKIRAVSASGRSDYSPTAADVVEVSTGVDTTPPAAPTDLKVKRTRLDKAIFYWKPASDDSGIREYVVSYLDSVISTGVADTFYVATDLIIDTTYNVSVKAVDLAGNESTAGNTVSFATNVTGLFYEHTPGYWNTLDSIDWSRPEYTGFVDNFTMNPKTQDDYFNFRFDGFLYVTTAGDYNFRISSDDGSRLYLNKRLIADNNGVHDLTAKETAVQSLDATAQRITVEFFEFIDTDSVKVEYRGPDTNNEWAIIPSAALRSKMVIATEPEVRNSFSINVYPNPTTQQDINIQVESNRNSPVSVRLIDPIGRVLNGGNFDAEVIREGIKISHEGRLNNGMYIIEVQQQEQLVKKKVLIKNQ